MLLARVFLFPGAHASTTQHVSVIEVCWFSIRSGLRSSNTELIEQPLKIPTFTGPLTDVTRLRARPFSIVLMRCPWSAQPLLGYLESKNVSILTYLGLIIVRKWADSYPSMTENVSS